MCGFTELEILESQVQPDVLTLVCPQCAAIQLYSRPHLERLREQRSQ